MMFEAIKLLILNLTDLYLTDNIFMNFLNGVKLPENNDYIIINKLYSRPKCAVPLYLWSDSEEVLNDSEEILNDVDTEINQMNVTKFQVDFYGENADTVANLFAAALQSFIGTTFMKDYNCTVEHSESAIQLTDEGDRGNYIEQFAVKFGLYNNTIITKTEAAFTAAIINNKFVR